MTEVVFSADVSVGSLPAQSPAPSGKVGHSGGSASARAAASLTGTHNCGKFPQVIFPPDCLHKSRCRRWWLQGEVWDSDPLEGSLNAAGELPGGIFWGRERVKCWDVPPADTWLSIGSGVRQIQLVLLRM